MTSRYYAEAHAGGRGGIYFLWCQRHGEQPNNHIWTNARGDRERAVGGHSGVLRAWPPPVQYLLPSSGVDSKNAPAYLFPYATTPAGVVWPWSSSAFFCVATTTFYPGRQRHGGGWRNPHAAGVSGVAACWVAGPVGWRPWSSYSWPGRPPLCTASWGKRCC